MTIGSQYPQPAVAHTAPPAIDAKQKGRIQDQPEAGAVTHAKPGTVPRPATAGSTEIRTHQEGTQALKNLEASFDKVSEKKNNVEQRLARYTAKAPSEKTQAKITKLTERLTNLQNEQQNLRTQLSQMRTQMGVPPRLQEWGTASTPDLMPKTTQPQMEPIAKGPISQPADPKAQAKAEASKFMNNALEAWGAVKDSERREGNLRRELKKAKEEIPTAKQEVQQLRAEVAQKRAQVADIKQAGRSNAEANRDALIDAETRLNTAENKLKNLETSIPKLEQQIQVAKKTPKSQVVLKDGDLVLAPRGKEVFGKSSAAAAKQGIELVLTQLENAQKAGINSFTLRDGSQMDANTLLREMQNSEFGREIIDKSPDLKARMGNIAHHDSFGVYAQDAKLIADSYKAQKANIDKMTARIGADQEKKILAHPLKAQFDNLTQGLTTRQEKLAALKKLDVNADIKPFFKSLGISAGAVDDERVKAHLLDLMENPKQVYIQADANFYPVNESVTTQIAAYDTYATSAKNITAEQRIAIFDLKSPVSLPTLKQLSGPKEKTEAVIKSLSKRAAALEGIPPESYQADLDTAFTNQGQNWNAGFAVLDRIAKQMR